METPGRKCPDGERTRDACGELTVGQELTGAVSFKAHDSRQRQAPWSHRADDS